MKELYEWTVTAQQAFEKELLIVLNELEKQAPELVAKLINALENSVSASHWLSNKALTDSGKTPIQLIAEDNRTEVLEVLDRIEYAIYS